MSIELLKYQIEMGVDELIESLPIDRTLRKEEDVLDKNIAKEVQSVKPKESELVKQIKNTIQPAKREYLFKNNFSNMSVSKSQISEVDLPKHTRKIASNCNSLQDLKEAVLAFKDLTICRTAINTVFSDGNPEAEVMLIGEAPGATEDERGIPFCGESGQLLDKALSFIDVVRKKNLYISNTVFWRPPGNRKPTPIENSVCLPFVERHIALKKPKVLLLCGATSANALLNNTIGITKLRGQEFSYKNEYLHDPIKTFAIFHPSYLLRQASKKADFWQDLLRIKQEL